MCKYENVKMEAKAFPHFPHFHISTFFFRQPYALVRRMIE